MKDGIVKAFLIMLKAHKGQKDKGGKPYWLHPLYVALHCSTRDQIIVALLHDTIEDTEITLDDLSGFSPRIQEAVKIMTHEKNIGYMEYIHKIAANPIAKAVKIQDLKHNMQLQRLKTISDHDIKRKGKYNKALHYLSEI